MASAGRAASTAAAAAPPAARRDRAAFGRRKEDRQGARGVLTVAAPALDGFIGILHRAQNVKVVSAIFAYVLVKWHSNGNPFPLIR